MELSKDDLEAIEKIAACAFSPREVAFQLGFKKSEFITLLMDEDSEAAIAYYKGLYSSEFKVRESIMLMARNASSPAQTLSNNLFNENRLNLIKAGLEGGQED